MKMPVNNKSRKKTVIISLLLLVALCVAVAIAFRYGKGAAECGNTAANFVVGQWAAENEGNYYYIDQGIYEVTKNKEKKKLVDSPDKGMFTTITYLNVTKEALYYVQETDDGSYQIMQRAKEDGTETILYQTKDIVYSLQAVGNIVYFQIGDKAYKIKKGQDSPEVLNISGDINDYLQSLYLRGDNATSWNVKLAYQADKGQIHGNWMYLYKEEEDLKDKKWELYRVSSDGRKEEKLGEQILSYNVAEDGIYYAQKEGASTSMFKMDYDGSNKTKLAEDTFTDIMRINIASDKVFFMASKDGKTYERYWMNTSGNGVEKLEE